jgi:hypothetical protein
MVQLAIDSGADVTTPYELLSSQVDGLSGVHGAFEFRCPQVADLVEPDATAKQIKAATALQGVFIDAQGVPDGADVILTVGYNGSSAGHLRVSVSEEGPLARMVIGHHGDGSDPRAVAEIRDMLRQMGDCSIHYMSGHAVIDNTVYQVRQEAAAFTG